MTKIGCLHRLGKETLARWSFCAITLTLFFTISYPAQSGSLSIDKTPEGPSSFCDIAALKVARESGIPPEILLAISRTETGRALDGQITPWPWTVNFEGRGHWFETKSDALAFVFDRFKSGSRSFDIGCFQINYRWHGEKFSSIEEMFDPTANSQYAGDFLKDLYHELGDWNRAIGAFHSRTAVLADRYMHRFSEIIETMASTDYEDWSRHPFSERSENNQDRYNDFPFLKAGSVTVGGSLVPLIASDLRRPFVDISRRAHK